MKKGPDLKAISMKTILMILLSVSCALGASEWERARDRDQAEIQVIHTQLAEIQRQQEETTNAELKKEIRTVLASLTDEKREVEKRLKEIQLRLNTDRPCPVCGGRLTKVGRIRDDRTKPSKNIAVWNRSMCANNFYNGLEPICNRCWFSQSVTFGYWERSSAQRDSFFHPLTRGICNFPVPSRKNKSSGGVYSQKFAGDQRWESVLFWCTDSPPLIKGFEEYCEKNGLLMEVYHADSVPKEVCITINSRQKDAGVSPVPNSRQSPGASAL